MLCPSCGKLISVSSERCPFCGASRPGLWGFGPALARVFGGKYDPVSVIPVVCIVLYVLALAIDPSAILRSAGLGILSPSSRALRLLGLTHPIDILTGRWWTLLSAIYLHGGVLHILFNVMWIRSLAPEVRRVFGPARFILIWTASGAVGFLVSNLLKAGSGGGSVGASGAIFGLMAALIVYGRAVGETLLTGQIWRWAIILVVLGFVIPRIDNLAHIGGFAGGWIAAVMFRGSIGKPDGPGLTLAALAVVFLTALSFILSIATGRRLFG
jgi:rhomboid protease GluP